MTMLRHHIASWSFTLLLSRVAAQRPPNLIVGERNPDGPYLHRWYVTPWRGWFAHIEPDARTWWQATIVRVAKHSLPNLYLHKFMRDDDDRALHDHPSWAISFILRGGYIEHTIAEGGIHRRREFRPGSLRFMRTSHAHRIELKRDQHGYPAPCWTLFLFGPAIRDWGFHCPQRGWVPWQEFTVEGQPGEVGPGCDA